MIMEILYIIKFKIMNKLIMNNWLKVMFVKNIDNPLFKLIFKKSLEVEISSRNKHLIGLPLIKQKELLFFLQKVIIMEH